MRLLWVKKKKTGLGFFPLQDKKAKLVPIPIELAKEASKSFNSKVVGYFLGPRLLFPIVQRLIKTIWSKHGVNEVMMNGNGFFFIRFNDGGSTRAAEEGMIMIHGVPLFVFPWTQAKGYISLLMSLAHYGSSSIMSLWLLVSKKV